MIRTDLIRGCVILWLIAVSGVASAAPGQDGRYHVFHYEELDAVVDHAARSPSGQTTLRFQAHGRDFSIRLADNRRLISGLTDEARARILSEIEIYRGELEGAPDSWARLTRRGTQWQGLIWDGYEFFVIEPGQIALASSSATASAEESGPIIYRLADTDAELSDLVIEVPESMKAEAALSATNGGEFALAMTNAATKRIDVAAIGDFEYTNSVIGDGQVEIVTFMNAVDGIFDSQVDIQINVVELRTFTQNNDPFSGTDEPIDLLNEVGDYKSSDPVLQNLGIVHLFTGVNLDGTTIGIAFLSSICSQQAGVSLSQATNAQGPVHLTAAHEIGHNFGAPHDGDAMGACGSVVGNFLMSPSLNGSDQFSACSVSEMQQVIATASCLTDIASGEVEVSIPLDPVNAFAGETISYDFSIGSTGGSAATNIVLDVTIPAGMVVSQASYADGSCTISATSVVCQRASQNSVAFDTATIDISGTTPGDYTITATVGADSDQDPLNNTASGMITLAPAADLESELVLADTFVRDGESTVLTVTFRNNGPQTADIVTATLRLGSLLTFVPGQSFTDCSMTTDRSMVCSFPTLLAGEQRQFVITVEALTGGNGIELISAGVTGFNGDFDKANNTAPASISVGNRFVDVSVGVTNAPTNVQTGAPANAVVTVNNDGPNSAESVMVSVTADPGVGSMGVAGPVSGGSCSSTPTTVDCTFNDLIGQQTFTINFTATAVGNPSILIASAIGGADDVDTNGFNDNATFSFTVSNPPPPPAPPPPAPSSSGGGGSTSLLLPILMLIGLRRRRIESRQA